jgi:hypothetical protein
MTTGGGVAASTAVGEWMRIGKLCIFWAELAGQADAAVGTVRLSIPFPNVGSAVPVSISRIAAWATNFVAQGTVNTGSINTTITITKNLSSELATAVAASDLSTAAAANSIRYCGFYEVA